MKGRAAKGFEGRQMVVIAPAGEILKRFSDKERR
jgi:hypothetical protein